MFVQYNVVIEIGWLRSIALNSFLAYPHVPGLTTATNLFYIEKAYEERGEEKMNQRNQCGKVELLRQSHFFQNSILTYSPLPLLGPSHAAWTSSPF